MLIVFIFFKKIVFVFLMSSGNEQKIRVESSNMKLF